MLENGLYVVNSNYELRISFNEYGENYASLFIILMETNNANFYLG